MPSSTERTEAQAARRHQSGPFKKFKSRVLRAIRRQRRRLRRKEQRVVYESLNVLVEDSMDWLK